MKRIKGLPETRRRPASAMSMSHRGSLVVHIIGIAIITAIAVGICDGNHHGKLTLSPAAQQVVHYVNDSHIVICNSHNTTHVHWQNPQGNEIKETRGRLHVENMPGGGAIALVFEAISLADKGNWTCQGADTTHRGFHLVVNQAISFMDTPTVQSAAEDKDAIIRCMVKGDPEPTVSWYYNGHVLNLPTAKYTKVADGLVIKKVSKNDSGEYTCKAYQVSTTISNTKEQTIRLNIQHRPVPPPHKASAEITFGYIHGTVNLTCEAEAEPAANFSWFRHNKKLSPKVHLINSEGHVSTLQVTVNDTKAFGDYRCHAQNSLGTLDRTITLQKGEKPEKPKHVELRGFSSDTFDVDVGAVRTSKTRRPMDIIGYRFEIISVADYRMDGGKWDAARALDLGFEDGRPAEDNTEGITYLINNLASNTSYLLRVASRNPAGLSDWTTPKEIVTQTKEPFGLPPSSSSSQTPVATTPLLAGSILLAVSAALLGWNIDSVQRSLIVGRLERG